MPKVWIDNKKYSKRARHFKGSLRKYKQHWPVKRHIRIRHRAALKKFSGKKHVTKYYHSGKHHKKKKGHGFSKTEVAFLHSKKKKKGHGFSPEEIAFLHSSKKKKSAAVQPPVANNMSKLLGMTSTLVSKHQAALPPI